MSGLVWLLPFKETNAFNNSVPDGWKELVIATTKQWSKKKKKKVEGFENGADKARVTDFDGGFRWGVCVAVCWSRSACCRLVWLVEMNERGEEVGNKEKVVKGSKSRMETSRERDCDHEMIGG